MTICIAGKNEIAINAMKFLLEHFKEDSLIACINQTDKGENTWQKSFDLFCRSEGIRIADVEELYHVEELLFISLEFDRLIDPKKFRTKQLYNIHFSKLPAYKGMYTSIMPLLYDETESGVTLHFIDEGIDTGDIIDQITFPLTENTTSKEIYHLYLENGFSLFKNNIAELRSGNVQGRPQDKRGSTYFSRKALDFKNLKINLRGTAWQIHNQIRAYAFRNYQLPFVEGKYIYQSRITPVKSTVKAGSIIHANKDRIQIATIDYDIILFPDRLDELLESGKNGDLKAIEDILKSNYPLQTRNDKGWDVFIVACYFNQVNVVEFLLKQGWDADTCNYRGTTALMYAMTAAVEGRGTETFILLFDLADKAKRDDAGKDVFDYAFHYNYKPVIDFIESRKK